jgi:hypothetical protein
MKRSLRIDENSVNGSGVHIDDIEAMTFVVAAKRSWYRGKIVRLNPVKTKRVSCFSERFQ